MAAHPGNYSDCEACSLQQLSYPIWLPIQEVFLSQLLLRGLLPAATIHPRNFLALLFLRGLLPAATELSQMAAIKEIFLTLLLFS
jgi:hypothetical protein